MDAVAGPLGRRPRQVVVDAHLETAHVKGTLERVAELWGDNGEIVVYDAPPAGETKKGSLAAHAGGRA